MDNIGPTTQQLNQKRKEEFNQKIKQLDQELPNYSPISRQILQETKHSTIARPYESVSFVIEQPQRTSDMHLETNAIRLPFFKIQQENQNQLNIAEDIILFDLLHDAIPMENILEIAPPWFSEQNGQIINHSKTPLCDPSITFFIPKPPGFINVQNETETTRTIAMIITENNNIFKTQEKK